MYFTSISFCHHSKNVLCKPQYLLGYYKCMPKGKNMDKPRADASLFCINLNVHYTNIYHVRF